MFENLGVRTVLGVPGDTLKHFLKNFGWGRASSGKDDLELFGGLGGSLLIKKKIYIYRSWRGSWSWGSSIIFGIWYCGFFRLIQKAVVRINIAVGLGK